MSIKSDRWIRQQCTPPSFIVTERFHAPRLENHSGMELGIDRHPDVRQFLSHLKDEELAAMPDSTGPNIPGIVRWQKATDFDLNIHNWAPMIAPFESNNIRYKDITEELNNPLRLEVLNIATDAGKPNQQKILSYGTSSFGYDVTLSNEFRIFTNINSSIIDPLNFDEKCLVEFKGDVCIIPPNSYILGVTREYFKIPRDVMVVCVGKSTYARCGAIVNVTPIEPGFSGHVVIEISNATNLPMKIYANQGVAQFLFFQSDEECETSYADKGGKYQNQTGMTLAKG
jgi:dCTP deaminase